MVYEALLAKVAARPHRMPAERCDPRAYERELREVFGPGTPAFDLVLLGIGSDGHTASLFPGDPALDERERLVVRVPRPRSSPADHDAPRALRSAPGSLSGGRPHENGGRCVACWRATTSPRRESMQTASSSSRTVRRRLDPWGSSAERERPPRRRSRWAVSADGCLRRYRRPGSRLSLPLPNWAACSGGAARRDSAATPRRGRSPIRAGPAPGCSDRGTRGGPLDAGDSRRYGHRYL